MIKEQLDTIIANQKYMTQLLETIVEAIPTNRKKPDVSNLLKPLMEHPMLKGNPMFAEMMNSFIDNVEKQQ